MHYYQHHIGDFIKDTARLSDTQSMAYLRLLWMYYDSEKPLKPDTRILAFQIGSSEEDTQLLLDTFFILCENGWHHTRCDEEIAEYHAYLDKKSNAGRASAERRKNNSSTGVEQVLNSSSTDVQLTTNQQPLTNKPKRESQRGTRLAPDFALPDEWVSFCRQQRPELDPRDVFDGFRDYWVAQPGQKGVKTDWTATWRNWVRRQQATQKTASEARQTAMAALTRGLAVPKPAAKPFWEKTENQVEVGHVERKRLL